jgi:allantoinase
VSAHPAAPPRPPASPPAAPTFALRSRRTVTAEGERPATVRVEEGRIAAVETYEAAPAGCLDLGDLALLPGAVDTHVHVDEPGRTEWEGFASATRAAAAGGVTTLVDMPLNSIPAVTTVAALEAKRAAAAGRCAVDIGFWGGVVPGNAGELAAMAGAGVLGFKAFLAPSGVDEFPHVGPADLEEAAPVLAATGLPLLVHAELASELDGPVARFEGLPPAGRRNYSAYLASRPAAAELAAIGLLLDLCRRHRFRLHVVHLAAAEALPRLAAARHEGLPVTVETCPHYLAFAAEEIADGATAWKCAPPIRWRQNREALWRGLLDGAIDLVASDHSPCPPDLKAADSGDFAAAWGGIASLQVALPALWTGARERGATLADVARWTAAAPARLAGLDAKGAIAPGRDADLVAFDPDRGWRLDAGDLLHRHPVCPWTGRRFRGRVEATWLCGVEVWDGERVLGEPAGRMLSA